MIYLISFTEKGSLLCRKILDLFEKENIKAFGYSKYEYAYKYNLIENNKSLYEWTKDKFKKDNFIVFIGACAIAVRAIAPFVKSKLYDCAVIVIDDNSMYTIPILSGHIGGANKFALKISELINSQCIITTSTDINNVFSVDTWALKNNMIILNAENIKHISSSLIENKDIGIVSDFDILCSHKNIKYNLNYNCGICISYDKNKKPFKNTLNLIPKNIVIGIGCRKNIDFKIVEQVFLNQIKANKIPLESIKVICTIDLKKTEKAILQIKDKYNIEFKTYSSSELEKAEGKFNSSEFVKKITGVDNVCERAASLNRKGKFILNKTSISGVTISIFMESLSVNIR